MQLLVVPAPPRLRHGRSLLFVLVTCLPLSCGSPGDPDPKPLLGGDPAAQSEEHPMEAGQAALTDEEEVSLVGEEEPCDSVEEELHGAWHEGLSTNGLFKVSWRIVGAEEIPLNEHFELELQLTKQENGISVPWEGADIDVQARMPAHRHGMLTRPVPIEMGGGIYRIPAMLFHMEGHWVLHVTVPIENSPQIVERATFELDIR